MLVYLKKPMESASGISRERLRGAVNVHFRFQSGLFRSPIKTVVNFFLIACFARCVTCLPNSTGPRRQNNQDQEKGNENSHGLIGCDYLDVSDVWVKPMAKLLTESAFRLVDLNKDGVLDVVFGFATGADGQEIPEVVCEIYFGGAKPCFGGVLALEGKTAKELWRYWSEHELYGINCNADLNNDGVKDCLAGGRGGAFHAVNGKTGLRLWHFGEQEAKNKVMNVYTPHITADLDNDGVADVLAIHGGDPLQGPGSAFRLSGRILLLSGKTGKVLRWVGVPDERESYYSPQIYQVENGTQMVLFGTGGETHNGSLWTISLSDLHKGQIDKAVKIYGNTSKGVMTPPVLLDITGDGVEDMVMSLFDTTVIAVDGQTYALLWNYTFPESETYVSPSPGYFNGDKTPDFLVKYNYGPGYPVYYHAETTVLDGRNGQPLVTPFMKDTVGSQASGLTISMEGYGNDIFLYWVADCLGHKGQGGEFSFMNGTDQSSKTRANLCKMRYKTTGYSKIIAMGGNINPPGQQIYYSEDRKHVENSAWINTTKEAIDFVNNHPKYQEDFNSYKGHESTADSPNTSKTERQLSQKYLDIRQFLLLRKVPRYMENGQQKRRNKLLDRLAVRHKKTNSKVKTRLLGNFFEHNSFGDEVYFHLNYKNNPKQTARGITHDAQNNIKDSVDAPFHPAPQPLRNIKHKLTKYAERKARVHRRNKHRRRYEHNGAFRRPYLDHIKKHLEMRHRLNRKRRHIGPHDNNGLQRLISTGTLAPPTLPVNHKDYNHSIDYIYGVYWFFPVKTQAILPEDQKCIAQKMSEELIRFDKNSKYHGLDHDAYEHTITDECLKKNGNKVKNNSNYRHQDSFNPYDLKMGQLTVYRLRLTCRCNQTATNRAGNRCATVLPYDKQQWPAYMGRSADSHWLPRQET